MKAELLRHHVVYAALIVVLRLQGKTLPVLPRQLPLNHQKFFRRLDEGEGSNAGAAAGARGGLLRFSCRYMPQNVLFVGPVGPCG